MKATKQGKRKSSGRNSKIDFAKAVKAARAIKETNTVVVKYSAEDGWIVKDAVRRSNNSETFRLKEDAVKYAKDVAKHSSAGLEIYSKDGKFLGSTRTGKILLGD